MIRSLVVLKIVVVVWICHDSFVDIVHSMNLKNDDIFKFCSFVFQVRVNGPLLCCLARLWS
jgi:hypothetical protein